MPYTICSYKYDICTKFPSPSSNRPLLISVKLKSKCIFQAAAVIYEVVLVSHTSEVRTAFVFVLMLVENWNVQIWVGF